MDPASPPAPRCPSHGEQRPPAVPGGTDTRDKHMDVDRDATDTLTTTHRETGNTPTASDTGSMDNHTSTERDAVGEGTTVDREPMNKQDFITLGKNDIDNHNIADKITTDKEITGNHISTEKETMDKCISTNQEASDTAKEASNTDKEARDTDKEASDTDKEARDTDKEARDTDKETRDTDKEAGDTDKEARDTDKEARDTDKETRDTDKEASDTNKEARDTDKEARDTAKETRDTDKEARDTDKEARDIDKVEEPKAAETDKMDDAKTIGTDKMEETTTVITNKVHDSKTVDTDNMEETMTVIIDKVDESKAVGTDKVEEPKAAETDKMDDAKTIGTDKVDEPMTVDTDTMDETVDTDRMDGPKTVDTGKVDEITVASINKVDETKAAETDKMDDAKTIDTDKVEEPKAAETDKMDDAKTFSTDEVEEPKVAETDKMDDAKTGGTNKMGETTTVDTDKVDEPKAVETDTMDDFETVDTDTMDETVDTDRMDGPKTVDTGKVDEITVASINKVDETKAVDTDKMNDSKTVDTDKKDDSKTNDKERMDDSKTVETDKVDYSKTVDTDSMDDSVPVDTDKMEETTAVDTDKMGNSKSVDTDKMDDSKIVDTNNMDDCETVETDKTNEPKADESDILDENKIIEPDQAEMAKKFDTEIMEKHESIMNMETNKDACNSERPTVEADITESHTPVARYTNTDPTERAETRDSTDMDTATTILLPAKAEGGGPSSRVAQDQEGGGEGRGEGRACCVRLPACRILVTLVACVLTEATMGVTYTSANLMPYLTSYLRNVTGEAELGYSDMLWVSNSLWLVMTSSILWLGLLERRMPRRLYFFIGVAVNAASFFATYWAVQTSLVAVVIVYGLVQGLAQAVLYPVCINIALMWLPQHKGLAAGITMAGYGGGAFLWNPLVTLWINPDNLQPDLAHGENVYFTQPVLLDRVPTCFLLLGGILTAVQLLCFLLISFPGHASPVSPPTDHSVLHGDEARASTEAAHPPSAVRHEQHVQEEAWTDMELTSNGHSKCNDQLSQRLAWTDATEMSSPARLQQCRYLVMKGVSADKEIPADPQGQSAVWGSGPDVTGKASDCGGADVEADMGNAQISTKTALLEESATLAVPEYGPLHIIKSRAIWTLWINNLAVDFSFIFIVSFYKTYGQTFIRNDHFLSIVASVAAIFNSACRPVWGAIADRLGYLPTLLCAEGILIVTSATFLTCELVSSSVMYVVWVCAMFASFSGIFALQGPLVMSLFGPAYFVFSLGVLTCSGAVSTLASIPMAGAILEALNWKGLFLISSGILLMGELCLVTLLLSCGGRPLPGHMKAGLLGPRYRRKSDDALRAALPSTEEWSA